MGEYTPRPSASQETAPENRISTEYPYDRAIANYSVSVEKSVRARFATNDLAENPLDTEKVVHDTYLQSLPAHAEPNDPYVLELGAANGTFARRIRNLGYSGCVVAVDINPHQFSQGYQNTPDSPSRYEERDFIAIGADASQLPLRDGIFDLATGLYYLYHVPEKGKALAEMKRVMKPDGTAVFATSAAQNKPEHRNFEAMMAAELGIEPPRNMNETFTTETAQILLPDHFKNVFMLEHKTPMIIKTEHDINIYLNSLRSMRDQFGEHVEHIPTVEEYEEKLRDVALPIIESDIDNRGFFTDRIERAIFFASDSEDFKAQHPDYTYTRIK